MILFRLQTKSDFCYSHILQDCLYLERTMPNSRMIDELESIRKEAVFI
jgi:hypothetical protein